MATKTFELIAAMKDLCGYTGTSRDNALLRWLQLTQMNLYNMPKPWRALEGTQDLYTTELMTLDVAPTTAWAVGDTIEGNTSTETCEIVEVLSTTTYNVKNRSGSFTLGEVLTNGTTTADQGLLFPTFAWNNYTTVPSDVGLIFDMRQMTTSPYSKLIYVNPQVFHEIVPQPTVYAYNRPRYYTWWGGRIYWYPIPDDDYTITMYYYKKPVDMKLYSAGTASVVTVAVTGVSTAFSTNSNVVAGMYFALTGDVLSNGTLPWAEIASITSTTALVLKSAYLGGKSGTAYACSSVVTFPPEFDLYLIYASTLMEAMHLPGMKELRDELKISISDILPGLIRNQTYIPDYMAVMENFNQQPIILGDDYAKFPFIMSNP
jgi:hypothetical protein